MSAFEFGGLMHATPILKNEAGEVVFSMKRKEGYYVFEKREEAMSEEMRKDFPKSFEMMCMGARTLGIPFYDFRELTDGINGHILATMKTKTALRAIKKASRTGKTVFVKDIDVKVFDHGTGKIKTITVGVSVPPVDKEDIKNLIKALEMGAI